MGSSSTSTEGASASAAATATRCISPPESVLMARPRSDASPSRSKTSSTRACIRAGPTPAFSNANATSSSTRSVTNWASGS